MSQVGRAFVQGRMALPPPESLGEQQSEIGPLEADPKLQWILEIAGPAVISVPKQVAVKIFLWPCNYWISSRMMASSALPSRSYMRDSHWQTKLDLAKWPQKIQTERTGRRQLSQHWQRDVKFLKGFTWGRAKQSIWRDTRQGCRTLSHCSLALRFWGKAKLNGKKRKRH